MMKLVITFASVLALSLVACADKSVDSSLKNPREYTWTIDTLDYLGNTQTIMLDIWGSSANDVYVVGFSSTGEGQMWHFDGNKWTDVRLSALQGGAIRGAFDLRAIQGFDANNVWVAGRRRFNNPNPPYDSFDSSLVIHGSGLEWRDHGVNLGRALSAISGASPVSIWASGEAGTICHYNGTVWTLDSVQIGRSSKDFLSLYSLDAYGQSEAYALGSVRLIGESRVIYFLFSRTSDRWGPIDSMVIEPGTTAMRFGIYGVWRSPEGTLYTYGPHIFRRAGMSWDRVYEKSSALEKMVGTSDANIFVVGHFGVVLHFNGTDWFEYRQLRNTNAVFTSVWTNGTEVFIVGYVSGGAKSLVLRGK